MNFIFPLTCSGKNRVGRSVKYLFFNSPGRMSGELLSYPRRRRERARVQKL